MTNEEHERLTRAIVAKVRPHGGYAVDEEYLGFVVGQAVADATLVAEGVFTIEDLEAGEVLES